jgi:hypothetical protein
LPNCWRPIFLVLPKLYGCQVGLPNCWSCSKGCEFRVNQNRSNPEFRSPVRRNSFLSPSANQNVSGSPALRRHLRLHFSLPPPPLCADPSHGATAAAPTGGDRVGAWSVGPPRGGALAAGVDRRRRSQRCQRPLCLSLLLQVGPSKPMTFWIQYFFSHVMLGSRDQHTLALALECFYVTDFHFTCSYSLDFF